MNDYKMTIGIEIHLELRTNSKVFSPSKNDYKSGANQNINEIDFSYPGVLPRVNSEVINKAIAACLGLNMNISHMMHFDRKNYYYPDLPKGYQITQMETPIGEDGYLMINVDGEEKKIGIERLHIEEDTCKSLHHNNRTLLNYNRCGVPLVEIVSCPDMHSPEEAMAYVVALREIMLYLGVSDCKIEEGSLRCDVNVSVSKDNKLGTRTEIKNIGSISNVGEAIKYEVKRQIEVLEAGDTLFEQTRKFDANKGETVFMRKKEPNKDYRYFPEPDIPYLYVSDEQINEIKDKLDMLPNDRRDKYLELGISSINTEKLIANKNLSDYLNKFLDSDIDFKIASNILLGDISAYLNRTGKSIEETELNDIKFASIVNALSSDKISSKIFKEILEDYLETDKSLNIILEEKGFNDTLDEDSIKTLVCDVLGKYPDSVNDYKNGKDNAVKFLMGMVMKESKGKANPKIANKLLMEELNK